MLESPQPPPQPQLSAEGLVAAKESGLHALSEARANDCGGDIDVGCNTTIPGGLKYVGDLFTIVLYVENGTIFEVFVTKDDEEISI